MTDREKMMRLLEALNDFEGVLVGAHVAKHVVELKEYLEKELEE